MIVTGVKCSTAHLLSLSLHHTQAQRVNCFQHCIQTGYEQLTAAGAHMKRPSEVEISWAGHDSGERACNGKPKCAVVAAEREHIMVSRFGLQNFVQRFCNSYKPCSRVVLPLCAASSGYQRSSGALHLHLANSRQLFNPQLPNPAVYTVPHSSALRKWRFFLFATEHLSEY